MSDDEKKQAYYIANAQGYCLEFRLSENTVNSYDTYKEERDKYTGTSGLDGGNWVPFRNWLIDNSFTCTWLDHNVPSKGGVTTLASGLDSVLREMIIKDSVTSGWRCYVGGFLGEYNGHEHSNAKDPATGRSAWGVWYDGGPWLDYGDGDLGYPLRVLLVRPL